MRQKTNAVMTVLLVFVPMFFTGVRVSAQSVAALRSSTASSIQSLTPDSIANLERQARSRGYSDTQIRAMKERYAGKGATSTPSVASVTDTPSDSADVQETAPAAPASDSASMSATVKEPTRDSRYFGYSLFGTVPDAFKPNSFGPVDPGYLVSAGDVLRLSVWGEVEFQYELKISKEGKIFIPVAGQVYVTGIPFELLQPKIKSLLSRHYSGLSSDPQKTFLDLSIAQIRPIRIFVMGEVAAPGGYTISSSSTAFNALYTIGGPLLSGTLRNIKVLRNQKELTSIDIYSYLVSGTCSTDVRLQNDDVVFIPRRGKTVTVTGSVVRPSIYELTEPENLTSLLDLCGGPIPKTNMEQALLYRVIPFGNRDPSKPSVEVISLDLNKYINSKEDLPLFDNDMLKIVPLADEAHNIVVLRGAVRYPGVYECDSLSLYNLIFRLGKLIDSSSYVKRADLIRLNNDHSTTTLLPIDLQKLQLDSAATDQPLQPFDEIVVYRMDVEKPTDLLITIDGEVRKPGIYAMSINQTVADVVLQAGGFSREAYRKSVDVYRLSREMPGSDTLTKVFKVPLPDSMDFVDHSVGSFYLTDRDRIVVRPDPAYLTDYYVTILGQVYFTGKYALKKRGERLSDVIDRAGGTLPDAFLDGATISRENRRLIVHFSEALSGKNSKENILLHKNDSIYIPLRPNTVLIGGNVNNPGLFSHVEGSKLKDYIARAGGFADSTSYVLLFAPGGESAKIRRCGFKNQVVPEGAEIVVVKKIARDNSTDKKGPSISEVIRDTLAILASAVTIIGLAITFNK